MKVHGGHKAPWAPCEAEGGAAADLLLGWWLWLRAWLTGGELPFVARGEKVRVETGTALFALPEGWCGVPDSRAAFAVRNRQAFGHLVVMIAVAERLGSRRVAFRRWRRLFATFTDFTRKLRGDCVLPRAHARRPEGGCGPPLSRQPSVLPPGEVPSKRGA